MTFIYRYYPLGSFDTRPLAFQTAAETFSARRTLLEQIFETFPSRRFVLLGDTTNPDVLRAYPELATTFPGQVQCILMRNVSTTEPQDKLPYNLDGFQGLKREMYMFYNTPDDLRGLDFYAGDCLNSSVKQYVGGNEGYGWRNLPGNVNINSGTRAGIVSRELALIVGLGFWASFFLL